MMPSSEPLQPASSEPGAPSDQAPLNTPFQQALEALRNELVGGLLYTHSRANANTNRLLEAASFLYALIEILQEKGLISIPELDARKVAVATRLQKRFLDKGMGAIVQEPERDKYALESEATVDCAARVSVCHAACCRLSFPLSMQDLREGVLRWDLRAPYLIAQDQEGYCQHLDRATWRCTVRAQRPVPCRAYTCANDPRIWQDFEHCIVNPDLETLFRESRDRGA